MISSKREIYSDLASLCKVPRPTSRRLQNHQKVEGGEEAGVFEIISFIKQSKTDQNGQNGMGYDLMVEKDNRPWSKFNCLIESQRGVAVKSPYGASIP